MELTEINRSLHFFHTHGPTPLLFLGEHDASSAEQMQELNRASGRSFCPSQCRSHMLRCLNVEKLTLPKPDRPYLVLWNNARKLVVATDPRARNKVGVMIAKPVLVDVHVQTWLLLLPFCQHRELRS